MSIGVLIVAVLAAWIAYDLIQRKHAILRSFPIIGHFRYWLEAVGPELRQYIVTGNDEERPFSRDQRSWVYASSKQQNNYFGFGTDNELERSPNYLIVKHTTFSSSVPTNPKVGTSVDGYTLPGAKILGSYRQRTKAFRPNSIVNISGMSFGSLSARAVEALNRGAKLAGCLHNTGEGGVSRYHQAGGDLIWQIGTGYFGCRNTEGKFDLAKFKEVVARNPIRAVEIKLSQGAKPGLGGVLPAAKVSAEIAAYRGVPAEENCISPSRHSSFQDVDSMLDFVEHLASETGLPIGIKSAVGDIEFWLELVEQMATSDRGVDFITIDGGEGGTGAGPLVFTDHVALPFKVGFSRVYRLFAERGLADRVVFIGSGKLGFPADALFAFSLGCDLVNVAREAMMAVGCIQAQRCHTGHCPTGVATQNRWLMRGLDPKYKAARLANYVTTLRKELLQLSHACGVAHPSLVTSEHFEVLGERFNSTTPMELFNYKADWGLPSKEDQQEIQRVMGARLGR